MFKWQKGRQNSNYYKWQFLNITKFLVCDGYFLHLPEGIEVPPHKDPAPTGKVHMRLNIVLKKPKVGGKFIFENSIINTSRIQFFKASETVHSMEKIAAGEIYILSLGWLKAR